MKSSLLLDERPLIIMPKLAAQIGLTEAIFLQQLHYWLDKSSHKKEGHIWIYNTVKEWQEQFPFWSESTIRRIVEKLEKNELIITGNFNKLPIDQTKWYRINYEKLREIVDKSNDSRNRQSSSQYEQLDCSKRAVGLVNLNTPLPEITTESTTDIKRVVIDTHEKELKEPETAFSFFQTNGFGILTPHVGEKIGAWIDDTNDQLVIHALKLAAENGILRWNYAEGILKDWEKRKIDTVEKVHAESERYKREGGGKHGTNGAKASRPHQGSSGSINGIEF